MPSCRTPPTREWVTAFNIGVTLSMRTGPGSPGDKCSVLGLQLRSKPSCCVRSHATPFRFSALPVVHQQGFRMRCCFQNLGIPSVQIGSHPSSHPPVSRPGTSLPTLLLLIAQTARAARIHVTCSLGHALVAAVTPIPAIACPQAPEVPDTPRTAPPSTFSSAGILGTKACCHSSDAASRQTTCGSSHGR